MKCDTCFFVLSCVQVGRIKWSFERSYTKLWIHHASKGDVGTYKVVITNSAGHASCSTRVKLKAVSNKNDGIVSSKDGGGSVVGASGGSGGVASMVKDKLQTTTTTPVRRKLEPKQGTD